MADQRKRAKAASKFVMDSVESDSELDLETEFGGYEHLELETNVVAIFKDGRSAQKLETGESGGIVLESTAFYAESGGQVGDRGKLLAEGVVFEVRDTQKQSKAHIHLGELKQGEVVVGQTLRTKVNATHRVDVMRNHSATHILHAALRQVLGKHVTQKGSLVAADRLRFDFSHPQALSDEEISRIENLCNTVILDNAQTVVEEMSLEKAMESGAMSLFGEKYESEVRVLSIGGVFHRTMWWNPCKSGG